MLKHADVWRALDKLASEYKFSASGLAKRAGLDPTTFNKSKRITPEGKLRWPSTESIAKVLSATGASFNEYVSYIGESGGAGVYRNIPLIGFAQAGSQGYFESGGIPTGTNWDEIPFPGFSDPKVFALEVNGDSMQPVFRDGDTLIISPTANIRRGDRVVLKTRDGEVLAKILQRQSTKRIELLSINGSNEDRSMDIEKVDWISRIIWASQ
ncbi:MAG: helix-turn-helix transcriptional regulator [Rhodospirillales bacterium]|nr:helix-turn-helix transcriptional regulator [Rhodospirillales bacterium]